MIQQVQNSCQFHGLSGDDANKHLDKFLQVTQSIKVNGVTDEALRLYLFPHSLNHHDTAWFDRLPRNSINTFEQMAKMILGKYFPPSMVTKLRNEITNFRQHPDESLIEAWERGTFMKRRPEECYDLIENMTAHHNDWDTSAQKRAYKQGGNSYQPQGTLPSNTITNPKEDLKVITTRNENAYKGPTIPTTSSPPKVVEHETEVTKDMVPPTNNGSTKDVQPSVVQFETPIPNFEPVVPVDEPFVAPKKLFELAKTPLNEHCSAVLLKKLPEKLGDPGKFLIPCDFPGMDECLALAELGTSINLMPLSVWNKISLPKLSPTCMTLELADRLISRLVRVTEDVFVKVGTFHFPVDFVVVDFDTDPRVLLILGRSFLKIERALIDVYEGELTLRDDFKPVQHQRRVNPKIYEVIKKEVLKLLDTGLIYPISDSPWVSPVYCVPKKGGFTVVENEENELIPTQLVTGWHVCIDYQKLNDATRKDHFPLPFMDQMLERLAGTNVTVSSMVSRVTFKFP
nr:reverse transcriptase domain-containing protein [Tanacetum cinerariifolium]